MVGGSSVKKTDDRKTPEGFLGANANLVNLNDLVTKPPQSGALLSSTGLSINTEIFDIS